MGINYIANVRNLMLCKNYRWERTRLEIRYLAVFIFNLACLEALFIIYAIFQAKSGIKFLVQWLIQNSFEHLSWSVLRICLKAFFIILKGFQ